MFQVVMSEFVNALLTMCVHAYVFVCVCEKESECVCVFPKFVVSAKVTVTCVSVNLKCQCAPPVKCVFMYICVCLPMSAWHLKSPCTYAKVLIGALVGGLEIGLFYFFNRVCGCESVCLYIMCVCVFVHVKIRREQSPAELWVPPDVTLLSSGADPEAEVGRLAVGGWDVDWVEVCELALGIH